MDIMIKTPFEVSFLYTKGGNTMEIDISRYREGLIVWFIFKWWII